MKVTEEDVDAAATFMRRDDVGFAAKVTIVPAVLAEAFAAHRQSAERRALERAAEMAEDFWTDDCETIAQAIRALGDK